MADRPYDLVLLGATGFTGRLVAAHLARRLAGTTARWAIAGRDVAKLEDLRDDLAIEGATPEIEIADVGDLGGLLELAEQTRVLATTVGPYVRYGELVVQACIRAGTHYCDITGEPEFVNLLLDRYDADARQHGVRIVNCCGFDSVPHDLGARFTVALLPDDVPLTVRGFVRAKGAPSGGTWQTLITSMSRANLGTLRGPRGSSDGRTARLLPPRLIRADRLGGYGVPLPTIDPAVVLRSARELPVYGPDFRYGHYAHVKQPTTVAGMVVGAGALAGLAKLKPTRELLLKLRSPGDGPAAAQRAAGWFQVTFVGEGGGQRVVTRVAGGDPGYDETAVMLGEAALSLANDDLPDRAGVLTPAVAMGEILQARLQDQGITFSILE
jgi:short subunit dehydrogenase-like uncharacterized protein